MAKNPDLEKVSVNLAPGENWVEEVGLLEYARGTSAQAIAYSAPSVV